MGAYPFHIMMNGIWVLIPIADATSSVGSITANIGRLLTVALAVTLTVFTRSVSRNGLFLHREFLRAA